MIENTPENREKLACNLVEAMDMDDLIQYAIEKRIEELEKDTPEDFDRLWTECFGEDEEDEEESEWITV